MLDEVHYIGFRASLVINGESLLSASLIDHCNMLEIAADQHLCRRVDSGDLPLLDALSRRHSSECVGRADAASEEIQSCQSDHN
jgi:hypothetical protein